MSSSPSSIPSKRYWPASSLTVDPSCRPPRPHSTISPTAARPPRRTAPLTVAPPAKSISTVTGVSTSASSKRTPRSFPSGASEARTSPGPTGTPSRRKLPSARHLAARAAHPDVEARHLLGGQAEDAPDHRAAARERQRHLGLLAGGHHRVPVRRRPPRRGHRHAVPLGGEARERRRAGRVGTLPQRARDGGAHRVHPDVGARDRRAVGIADAAQERAGRLEAQHHLVGGARLDHLGGAGAGIVAGADLVAPRLEPVEAEAALRIAARRSSDLSPAGERLLARGAAEIDEDAGGRRPVRLLDATRDRQPAPQDHGQRPRLLLRNRHVEPLRFEPRRLDLDDVAADAQPLDAERAVRAALGAPGRHHPARGGEGDLLVHAHPRAGDRLAVALVDDAARERARAAHPQLDRPLRRHPHHHHRGRHHLLAARHQAQLAVARTVRDREVAGGVA